MTGSVAEEWQRRSDRRRRIVLVLEILATSSWIVYGVLGYDVLVSWMWIVYYSFAFLLFLPGLLYVIRDMIRTRRLSALERAPGQDAEKEDKSFTRTIINASLFLAIFMMLCIVPAFYFLTLFDAYLWSSFFVGIFVLVIATLAGACWKLNTSWSEEELVED